VDVNRLWLGSIYFVFNCKDKMKYSKIREELDINVTKGASEDLAILTHHLQAEKKPKLNAFADEAGVYVQTLNGKVSKQSADAAQLKIPIKWDVPFPPPEKPKFTFIDLFAGIGGFRIAMQSLGGKCVYSNEWDHQSKKTYEANFGEVPFGDITKQSNKDYIPETFDVLCAGFPCQAFSIAGKRGGFEDTRGTLFFDVAQVLKKHKPKAFFLENVKGLRNHDKGKTLATILHTLRNDLGYFVPDPQIVNAKDFGVPQNRERIFIVGFLDEEACNSFTYPKPPKTIVTFADVKAEKEVSVKYYLSTRYLKTLRAHKARHASKGNGFGYAIVPDDGIASAIVVGGMGRERNLVNDDRLTTFEPITHIKGTVNREGIRKMTPREWARLQGYPDNYIIPVADASAYKQFGNSVAVPAIKATAKEIINKIC
jgi:DNA (cytosine-5)-methyltransferase 1